MSICLNVFAVICVCSMGIVLGVSLLSFCAPALHKWNDIILGMIIACKHEGDAEGGVCGLTNVAEIDRLKGNGVYFPCFRL